MKLWRHNVLLFVFLFIFWIFLTDLSRTELITGLIISAVITLIFSRQTSLFSDIKLTPRALLSAVAYLVVFLQALIKSNLDVAWRVISPDLPINPGIVKVRTSLKSPLGRIILANSITLTPGTLTVETRGEIFYIHWIDITTDDIEKATEAIVSRFEKYLEVIFG